MVITKRTVTPKEFDQFLTAHAHEDQIYELINGEIVEKMPSNTESSQFSTLLAAFLVMYMRQNPIGYVTGEAGGYTVDGERYAPDAAVILKPNAPTQDWFAPFPPNLAVEVDYPSSRQSLRVLSTKISHYLAAGTVVWVVFPEDKEIEVHIPGQAVKILRVGDTLDGGAMLPGFTLPVSEIFPPEVTDQLEQKDESPE